MKNQNIKVIVEKTKTGYSAFAKNFAVFTTGKNMKELRKNMLEALNFHFEDENRRVRHKDII